MKKRIILAGATGLVGRQVAAELSILADTELHILARREAGFDGMNVHIADPAIWAEIVLQIRADCVISCLGTTMRTAGSKAAFAAVDLDLVLAIATAARDAGARQMISVSSVGASAASRNFYLRTKGEMEAGLSALDFERLDILHPGLLVGARDGDWRVGERIAIMLSPATDLVMLGGLRRYRSIAAQKVAEAVVTLAFASGFGSLVHEYDAIQALSG